MICPHCHTEIPDDSRFCSACGNNVAAARSAAQTAGNAALLLGSAAREARLHAEVSEDQLLDERTYNSVLLGVLLWGVLINLLLCVYVGDVYRYINPVAFLIGYMACAFAGILIAGRSRNPAVSFLGYNLVVVPLGLVISTLVALYGGVGSRVVADAFMYTLFITLGMTAAALIWPNLFARLGGALLGVLFGLVLCELALLFLRREQAVTDWIAAGIFSLYIGYDVYRSQRFPRTVDNAVDCALDIYLDLANLFIRLLSILGRRRK